jgi:hypothetical protein
MLNFWGVCNFAKSVLASLDWLYQVQQAFADLKTAVQTLCTQETEATFAYGVFLLMVAAIAQQMLPSVRDLFSTTAISQVIKEDGGLTLIETSSELHIPFTDPHYLHHYRVYLFREHTNEVFPFASLSMDPALGQHPTATLVIQSPYNMHDGEEQIFCRTFRGRPMLSIKDDCVYIAMSDDHDQLFGLLTFHYTPFRVSPMYYRSGFWIRSSQETHRPQVQKVVITATDLDEDMMPYVKGLLKMDSKQFMISQRQLDIFLETFQNAPWMEDFRQNYLPMFDNHKKVFYCFNDDEILSCSVSDLPPTERLKVLLALKSVDPPSNAEDRKFIRCEDPSGTYRLVKPESSISK